MSENNNAFGKAGERRVQMVLYQHGRKTKRMKYACEFDLLVDDIWRVEVKTAKPQKRSGEQSTWKFNLHRHGKLLENTDWYILRMEDVPFTKRAIHLLLRSPVGKPSITVTLRGLLNGKSIWTSDFKRFAKGEIKTHVEK
jgi:hypothetical protein